MNKKYLTLLGVILASLSPCRIHAEGTRIDADLSGQGWSLWQDKEAGWQNDELFAPPVDLAKVPTNPPTGGWQRLDASQTKPVAVPGTVEEYFGAGHNPADPQLGVSWWFRTIHVPAAAPDRQILLRFESIRLRAEVYVNHKLVAYDLVGDTPLEINLTGVVKPGEDAQLAVRVTNPGGTFDWVDFHQIRWGKYLLPAGHAFSGITGPVGLSLVDPVYVADIYMQNSPVPGEANAILTLENATSTEVTRAVEVTVHGRDKPEEKVFSQELSGVVLKPGQNVVTIKVTAPEAKPWDLDTPNLYVAAVALKTAGQPTDAATQTFGFRWFAPEGFGTDAMYRLNGRRVVLRTSISWGFWPINGIYPTAELAERQIHDAKNYGLNMLNFHRCIGKPIVMDKADELGLLYFEEPGGYVSGGPEAFGQALAREKLFRMVKRDRSHPSLVIYNMINEQYNEYHAATDETLFSVHRKDQIAAHALDPSRVITYTSMVADVDKVEFPEKDRMHMRPFDTTQYMIGEVDHHRADGPEEGVWIPSYYQNPKNHYGYIDNKKEIIYWGEEGATPSPPRLELIKKELAISPNLGWDGETYLKWYDEFAGYLDRKKLRGAFPTVDSLCVAMGAPALEQQGRKIEDTRICDDNDGYAINGWESELFENHSGVVDCFRNPKSDPAILAYYNQPVMIAVKVRSQIVQIPNKSLVDFYVLNEKNVHGNHTLKVEVTDPAGRSVFHREKVGTVTGGDVFGQLLDEAVEVPIQDQAGFFTVHASLVDGQGKEIASGHDRILAVDWKGPVIVGRGAVWDSDGVVRRVLKEGKGMDVPEFDPTLQKLDWVLVASAGQSPLVFMPSDALRDATGTKHGLTATFYKEDGYDKPVGQRVDARIDYNWGGESPDPSVGRGNDFWIRWEGHLIPPSSGEYVFNSDVDDEAALYIDDKPVIYRPHYEGKAEGKVILQAGHPVNIRYDYHQGGGGSQAHLRWAVPDAGLPAKVANLFERASTDGTNLVFIEELGSWMDQIAKVSNIRYTGMFNLGGAGWVSGRYFVRDHPLFKGLPVDQALNWPYVSVLHKTRGERFGLNVEGEELVAGAYNTYPMNLGTAVGVASCGKAKIVFSILPILSELDKPGGPPDVARKLLVNYLQFAAGSN